MFLAGEMDYVWWDKLFTNLGFFILWSAVIIAVAIIIAAVIVRSKK